MPKETERKSEKVMREKKLNKFVEEDIFHYRIRDGKNIYCDDDGRWFITGSGETYYSSFAEVLQIHYGILPTTSFGDDILANEIFTKIRELGRKQFEHALKVREKLATDEDVSDGELLDALFQFGSCIDIANPLGAIVHEIFERYMLKIEMEVTPRGIRKEWLQEGGE